MSLIRLVGIGVLVLMVYLLDIDLGRVVGFLGDISDPYLIFLAALAYAASQALRVWRMRYIYTVKGNPLPYRRLLSIWYSSSFLGQITPGRLGEFIKVVYFRGDGLSLGAAAYLSVYERFLDLIGLTLLALLSALAFPSAFTNELHWYALVALIAAGVAVALVFLGSDLWERLQTAARWLAPRGMVNLLEGQRSTIGSVMEGMHLRHHLLYGAVSVAILLSNCLIVFFIAASVGIPIALTFAIFSVVLSAFARLLPISILGLGTRDAVLVVLFSAVALTTEQALTFSFIILFILLVHSLIGFIAWMRTPFILQAKRELVEAMEGD